MLPSRGIVRSLPSAGARRHIANRTGPSATTTLGNGRQFGTMRRSAGAAHGLGSGSAFQLRSRQAAVPIVLGSVASTRNLSWPSMSLWGYGKKNTEAAAADSTTTTTGTTPVAESSSAAQVAEPSTVQSTAQAVADSAPTTDLSAISDMVNNTSASATEILGRSEEIGYLSSLGLDYGYGPTSLALWVMEHIHVYAGLGWAASICATAVVIRALMLYPTIKSTRFSADMKKMQADPRFPEMQQKLQAAIGQGDRTAQAQAQMLNSMLRQEYKVPFSGMVWGLLPIPFSYGLFRAVTGMTGIPVPALENGGMLWFTDLTIADPYMILPAVTTGLMFLTLKFNAKNTPKAQQGTLKTMQYILVPVMLIGTSFLSAAINLMGVSFGVATLLTTMLTNNNAFRRTFGIPEHKPEVIPTTAVDAANSGPNGPIITPSSGSASQQVMYEAPRQSMREKLTASLDQSKKGAQDYLSKMTGSAAENMEQRQEKERMKKIRDSEERRRNQEREHFEQKYKRKQ